MKTLVVQQNLHGYSEGHRLLEGSLKLPDDLARLVLRMSDLSGGSVVSGFEEYITGYPLVPVNVYALGRTWYASEMPRPGCVWTHTLLIPGDSLGEIPCLERLIHFFARPETAKAFDRHTNTKGPYSQPLEIDLEALDVPGSDSETASSAQIREIADNLYAMAKSNLLIAAQSSRGYELALFRLWSQQWPSARKSFSFCTGALSARGFAGKPFDVQCAPPVLIREITTSALAKHSQELNLLVKDSSPKPAWLDLAVKDAVIPEGGTFRELLWQLGRDSSLKEFSHIAEFITSLASESRPAVSEVLDKVAKIFPDPVSGRGLKENLFGREKDSPKLIRFDEGDLLASIASTEHFEAFDSQSLQLRMRGADLCCQSPHAARETISKLFRSPLNKLGEDVLAGMIEAIDPSIAREVTQEQPQFLPMLFRAKPELGVSPELWVAAGDRNRELFEALISHNNLGDSLIAKIVEALLASNSEFLLRRALEGWGKPAVFGALEWMEKSNRSLSERSLGALTFHVPGVVEWMLAGPNRSRNMVVMAAHLVAPFSYQIRQFHTDVWLKTFHDLLNEDNSGEATYFAAFLLALGFQNAPPHPIDLVVECFERLHQIAWDDAMPDSTWIVLDPIVPHLMWLHDWDKCERMRRGLIEAFIRNHWPLKRLFDCVADEQLLSRVLDSARKVDGGRQLISQET